MKILKYEHSCLDISENGGRLIVDPGIFSKSLTDFTNVAALVVTHIHPDHFDSEKVEAIIAANPNVNIFTTKEVAEKIKGGKITTPETQKVYTVGPFTLEFFGEYHGIIDPSVVIQNIGVLVNQKLYYPGDSLTVCDKSFEVLAIPTAAPWLTTTDLPGFLEKLGCKEVFTAHDGLLNEAGDTIYKNLISMFTKSKGKTYLDIKPGQSIEI